MSNLVLDHGKHRHAVGEQHAHWLVGCSITALDDRFPKEQFLEPRSWLGPLETEANRQAQKDKNASVFDFVPPGELEGRLGVPSEGRSWGAS